MNRDSFTSRKRLFFRGPALLAGIAVVCTGISLVMFYETLMRQHEAYLANEVAEQLNWLNLVGRSNQWDVAKTLEEYAEFGAKHHVLGKTGEFVLAAQEGNEIRFLLQRDSQDPNARRTMTDAACGEPMRRALAGNKGTMIGVDHRGHTVLAAFTPVPNMNWGIVATTDLSELLWPFLKSATIIAMTVLLVILCGIPLVVRLGRPLIQELEQSQEGVALAIQGTRHGTQT
jgi:hypothetical protein